jgi:dihydroorotate dehydrogenase electron transfer subunit
MTKRIESLKVIDNKQIKKDFFVIELAAREKIPEIKPGQFVEVKVENSPGTFLRRPFSVHDVDYDKNSIKLLVQVVGNGTQALSEMMPGDQLNLIYPLGNCFSLPDAGERSLLIGGGCGIAPMLFLGKFLKNNGFVPDILVGFRNSERILEYSEYKKIGEVFITTEDGSEGEKGFVTDHSVLTSHNYEMIYCCGPEAMMKAVAQYCKKKRIACEVSLENLMGCGIGACLCCVVETVNGNKSTCIEGPVFNINDLKW